MTGLLETAAALLLGCQVIDLYDSVQLNAIFKETLIDSFLYREESCVVSKGAKTKMMKKKKTKPRPGKFIK